MLVLEDHCVDCPSCTSSCNRKAVEVFYCDNCDDLAVCRIDNEDFCEKCAKEYLTEEFWLSNTVKSAADHLQVEVEMI